MIDVDELVGSISLAREHQTRAVRAAIEALLVRKQRGVVLADEVGCGKTYEALATTAMLWRCMKSTNAPIRRVLIVAKPALMEKWLSEIESSQDSKRGFPQYLRDDAWAGFREMLRNVVHIESRHSDDAGVRSRRKLQVQANRVYLVKPSLLTEEKRLEATGEVRWLAQTDWDVVIADEAHHYARLNNKISQVFFPQQTADSRDEGLRARYTLALTATPFQLSTMEMINLFRVINAPETDLAVLAKALPRFERGLETFYGRRSLSPTDPLRVRAVEHLGRLRTENALGDTESPAEGLELILRRYLIRNVKESSVRDYGLVERTTEALTTSSFDKLDDVRRLVQGSPLLPLTGNDAWVYLNVRDLIAEVDGVARLDGGAKRTFIAGDLRQCLSSYEQLVESALLGNAGPSAKKVKKQIKTLKDAGHTHPKVRALGEIVDRILVAELDRLRANPAAHISKIVVFNKLMHTARALKAELERVVAARIEPFIDEEIRAAGAASRASLAETLRHAVRTEKDSVREMLEMKFASEHMQARPDLLDGTGITLGVGQRDLVDVFFHRLENHCTQPLFLMRTARWLRAKNAEASDEEVTDFLTMRITEKLRQSLSIIIDAYLDDTPDEGEAFSEENDDRARRAISRLARILSAPDYVGRFDGRQGADDREMRRESFNRPYAPLLLLVSSVGEEGIDLQQHARYILHYDVEWNPAKMEQREGRVDREGRRTIGAVQVSFFLLKDTYEERIFHTVMQRDAWFQILIGSKHRELAGNIDGEDADADGIDVGHEEVGCLTADERSRVMLDLRPRSV